jgi:hypothetical protein
MRKRKHLIWVLGLALAVGVSAVALGAGNTNNTQTMDVTLTPGKQSANKFGNAKLRSVTTTGSTTTGAFAITPVSGDPGAVIYYDKDIKFDNKGLPTCNLSQLEGTLPATALARCGKAKIGTGQLTVGLAGSPDPLAQIDGSILAFNGKPKNGHPILYLHVRVPAIANTSILTGTLLKQSGKFGWKLNVKVDPLPNGAAAKVFDVTVGRKPWITKKHVRRHGHRVTIKTKHFYVAAKCADGKWDYKGHFNYASNGGPARSGSLDTTDSQPCTKR